jgi:putative molybdopterin biosynthesis protein
VKRYLKTIPLPEAISLLTSTFACPKRYETIPVEQAAGRVLAEPVYAPQTIPRVRIATMDGIAVKSADTISAQDRSPVELTHASVISTGQEVLDSYDAIIAHEEIRYPGEGRYQICKPARIGQNIRQPGDEVTEGRLILIPGHRITPSDIGGLLTYGITTVSVRHLIVGLIPTGDELIDDLPQINQDQVRESNTRVIVAELTRSGIHAIRYPIVSDDQDAISAMIRAATQECDIVIITAGSSAGVRDKTSEAIRQHGSALFHGVAIKPGKSMICGAVDSIPVIGLPGQPLAALTAWREVVLPLLCFWGHYHDERVCCTGMIGEPVPSNGGIDEFIPVLVIRIAGENIIIPRSRGPSGQIQTIQANAVLHVPASSEGYREGAMVQVRLTRCTAGHTLLLAGISDPLTDILQIRYSNSFQHLVFRSTSPAGAVALLCKKRCHGIIIAQSSLAHNSDAYRLLTTGCPDQFTMCVFGIKDGEPVLLVHRDSMEIHEEISPLLSFLQSQEWMDPSGFPEGFAPEMRETGMKQSLHVPDDQERLEKSKAIHCGSS